MKKYFFLLCSILFIYSSNLFGQITDYELGSKLSRTQYQQTGYYDLSDPEAVNIKVAVWGFVRYPGKYLVPSYTTILDLLSFAGGPTNDSHLDEIKLYRNKEDGSQEMLVYDYNDILWETKLDSRNRNNPFIEAGDILVVPGSPRYYARDLVSMWATILSALVSIAILVLNLVKN
ncbi:MAG TPA: SLBB domain-containing protein [Melioribacteraceae bacterium]|nr:SLBB domain-containing protein [Melioribacteraceae bacterium]